MNLPAPPFPLPAYTVTYQPNEVTNMPGSWEYQPSLTTYDAFVFYNAIGQHEDYFYHPIAVAKQVVNGINYRFMTIAEPKQAGYAPHFALVTVYQPPGGQPYATAITPISV